MHRLQFYFADYMSTEIPCIFLTAGYWDMDGPLGVKGDAGRKLSWVVSRALFTFVPSSPMWSWADG